MEIYHEVDLHDFGIEDIVWSNFVTIEQTSWLGKLILGGKHIEKVEGIQSASEGRVAINCTGEVKVEFFVFYIIDFGIGTVRGLIPVILQERSGCKTY